MDDQEGQKEKKLEIIMKDYELLKTYSTSSSPGIRYNIISFALATIGIVTSGLMFALSSGSSGNMYNLAITVAIFLMVGFIPPFCIFVLAIWLGEEHRMIRIGKFCQSLEKRINEEFGKEVLSWETFKRKPSESIMYPELFVILLFLGISFGSSLIGFYIAKSVFGYFPLDSYSINIIFLVVLYLIIHLLIALWIFIFVKRNLIHEKPIST